MELNRYSFQIESNEGGPLHSEKICPRKKDHFMKPRKLFDNLAQKTHMPFYNDGELVFCINEQITAKHFGKRQGQEKPLQYRPWKIAHAEWGKKKISPVEVPLPDDAILCNPTFYKEDGLIFLSFVAGITDEDRIDYHLYQMFGPSWKELCEPVQLAEEHARTGFISPRHHCFGGLSFLTLFDRKVEQWSRLSTSLQQITRAIYDPVNPANLLLTGSNETGDFRTLRFNVDTGETLELKGPVPLYKSCLVNDKVVFSHRESDDLEDYHLCLETTLYEWTVESVNIESR